MLLTDDDRNCIDMDNMAFDIGRDNRAIRLPLKPNICRFFIPKTGKYKSIDNHEISTVNSKEYFFTDNDDSCKYQKIIENERDLRFHSENSKIEKSVPQLADFMESIFARSMKDECFVKMEMDHSQSPMPRISGVCSISTQSLSDCDYNDQLSLNNCNHSVHTPAVQSPVVKDVYSLTNALLRQPLSIDTDDVELVANPNPNGADGRPTLALVADQTPMRYITNFLPVDNGSDTDEMTEDGDWVVDRCWQPGDNRMQPIVLLERLPLDRIVTRTRKRPSGDRNPNYRRKYRRLSKSKPSSTKHELVSPTTTTTSSSTKSSAIDELNDAKCLECSQRFPCADHPTRWIVNENVSCPFIEYVTTGAGRNCRQCFCNRNELDHIQIGLPKAFQLKESSRSEIGIWTKTRLARGTIIGPYLGEISAGMLASGRSGAKYSPYKTRRVSKADIGAETTTTTTTVADEELPILQYAFKSNWLRCINVTCDDSQANMRVLRDHGGIFYQAIRMIDADKELFVCNKLALNLIKLDKEPIAQSAIASRCDYTANIANIDHLKSPLNSPDNVRLTEGALDNIGYSGITYEKEVLTAMAKIWQIDSKISVTEVLAMVRVQYPALNDMPEAYVADLAMKMKSRYRRRSPSKADKEMIAYIGELFRELPNIRPVQINQQIRTKFPTKPHLNDDSISRIIRRRKLRPLKGIDANIDRKTVETIVEMCIDTSCLTLGKINRTLRQRFPTKPPLDCETIANIMNLNNCRLGLDETDYWPDDELVAKIKSLVAGQPVLSKKLIFEQLKICFPTKTFVTRNYVDFVIKKLKLKTSSRKLDAEMKTLIYQLHQNNPRESATQINEQLRSLLPDKPHVHHRTISDTIRHWN